MDRTGGTNSCLTIARVGAFDDSGGTVRYVRLVERVARSHILQLPSDPDLQLFYQIVQGVRHYGLALVKDICERSGENSEDGFHHQQGTSLSSPSVMLKIWYCFYWEYHKRIAYT
jgi:hypothetical protein